MNLKILGTRVSVSQTNKINRNARGYSAILLLLSAALLSDVKILSLLYNCRNY